MIEVENISKYFEKKKILNSISFTLNKGITAFVGANGAGKTTSMNIIVGATRPEEGKVLFDGQDIYNCKESGAFKKNIGYLPENNPLYEDMYIREYLEYSGRLYIGTEGLKKRSEEVLFLVGLEDEQQKKIRTLSYGNKQRVGLAQALLHDPEFLVLDEPSNGLDPIQRQNIYELLKKLGRTKTILFSSHQLDDLSKLASHYLILKNGELVLNKSATEISSIKETFHNLI